MRHLRAGLCAVACGCGGATAPATPAGPPAAMQPAPAADDVLVASVNGRPVYGSCVAIQASRHHVARDVALRECVDFELMAQTAEQRGLAHDPEVVQATRGALVDQLVATDYERAYARAEDFGGAWDDFIKKKQIMNRLKHAEFRSSVFVRVPVAVKPPSDDPAAHQLADRIAAALADERGLMTPHVLAIARQFAAFDNECTKTTTTACWSDVQLYSRHGLEDAYADALWAIPEIGRASPAVRTSYGWDVIVWTDVLPATDPSPDDVAAAILPQIRPWYFPSWVNKLQHALGLHVEVDPDVEKLLEAAR
jgi:hypothetical protein